MATRGYNAPVKKKAPNPLENDPEALEAHIEQLEKRFDRLKSTYESFFSGVEKQVPAVQRREMNRQLVQMQQVVIGKATLRFRYQSLLQRWITYTAYWNRVVREIEQGTYRRDVAKMQRHLAKSGGTMTDAEAIAMGVPGSRVRAFVDRQNRMVAARGGAVAPEKRPTRGRDDGAFPGVTPAQLQAFYDEYNKARAQVGDQRPSKSLDELAQKLRPQIEKVLSEARASRARLEVSIEGGKVRVLARPDEDPKT